MRPRRLSREGAEETAEQCVAEDAPGAPLNAALGARIMTELPDETHQQIQRLSAEGDSLAEAARYPDALAKYWAAWELLPEPKTDWEAATWLLGTIGNANFLAGDFEAGRDNLSTAMHCPGAIGNPFLHLRLGQCQLELGNHDRAADELARAYMAEGHRIFIGQDAKYLTFLKTRLDPPPGGWADERKKPWWKPW
jgi:tetratricopeptide (TPR) repeat protein